MQCPDGRKRVVFAIPTLAGVLASLVLGFLFSLCFTIAVFVAVDFMFIFLPSRNVSLLGLCLTIPDFRVAEGKNLSWIFSKVRGELVEEDAYMMYWALGIVFVFKVIINLL